MDLILTGRAVGAEEALRIGLVNEIVADGEALNRALALPETLCGFPQGAMRNDRLSAIEQWGLLEPGAALNEVARGLATIETGGPARRASGTAPGRAGWLWRVGPLAGGAALRLR